MNITLNIFLIRQIIEVSIIIYGNHAPFINNWIKYLSKLLNGKYFDDYIKLKHALRYLGIEIGYYR